MLTFVTAFYKDSVFLVAPTMSGFNVDNNHGHFYHCVLNNIENSTICTDLCDEYDQKLPYCYELITFESCVTTHNEYLYISGGSISSVQTKYITVFNMKTLDWESVPPDTVASEDGGYPSWFGSLAYDVSAHGCAYWNKTLFVLGGKDGISQSYIQKCDERKEDYLSCYASSRASLAVSRFYHQSMIVGSSIVTVCGSHSVNEFTDSIEVYDIINDRMITTLDEDDDDDDSNSNSGSITIDEDSISHYFLYGGARKSCCAMNGGDKLYVSGGETIYRGRSVGVDSIISTEFQIIENEEEEEDEEEIIESNENCATFHIDSSDSSFSGDFNFWKSIGNFYVWTTNGQEGAIYLDSSQSYQTWIGNFTNNEWSYNPEPGIYSGHWVKLKTKSSHMTRITMEVNCLEYTRNNVASSVEDSPLKKLAVILGLTETVFVALVIIISVVLITFIMVIFCCWWYRVKYAAKNKNEDKNKNENENDDDDDDNDDNNGEENDLDQEKEEEITLTQKTRKQGSIDAGSNTTPQPQAQPEAQEQQKKTKKQNKKKEKNHKNRKNKKSRRVGLEPFSKQHRRVASCSQVK